MAKTAELPDPVSAFAQSVIDGKVPACRTIRLGAERHFRDLETGAERGLYFDRAAALHALEFFGFLRHSKAEWRGQQFVLLGWQEFVVGSLFGWKRADGTRRFRVAYNCLPRKNGKSTLAAGIGLYLEIADGEPGAEVYSAATKKDQAKIVWEEARSMVKATPALKRRIRTLATALVFAATGSTFIPLGADADTMDGLNVHGCVIDELHAHKTRAAWDVLDTATGSRRQPLLFAITTAGTSRYTICGEQHDYAMKVLEGTVEEDEWFVFIAAADPKPNGTYDWTNPKTWAAANPSYGVSVKAADLERKVRKAKTTPSAVPAFLRLHLDIWTAGEAQAMDMDAWGKCAGPVPWADMAEFLAGRPCYGGLDLSSKKDLTAWVLLFPPLEGEEGGLWFVLPRMFMPGDNIPKRVDEDRVPYDAWLAAKALTATEGNVIDQSVIQKQMIADSKKFEILEVAFDRWGSQKLVTELQDEGFTVVEFGQGFKDMAAPTKALVEEWVPGGRLAHGGHPAMAWMAQNLVTLSDDAENLKPTKKKSSERIDGIVALIMAAGRALVVEPEEVDMNAVIKARGGLA